MKNSTVVPALNNSHEHLRWAVLSRHANQNSALKLLELLDTYESFIKADSILLGDAQRLVSASFSLWRAAFLADKTGESGKVFDGAREFLSRIIGDNTISYPQDKAAREWSFSYYMNAARYPLKVFSARRPNVDREFEKRVIRSGPGAAMKNWSSLQEFFDVALASFERDLRKLPIGKAKTTRKKKTKARKQQVAQ